MKLAAKVFSLVMVVMALVALTACSQKEATLESSHAFSETTPFEYGGTRLGDNHESYLVNLYSDGTYSLVYSKVTILGGTNGGVTIWESFGKYVKGGAADGFLELTLEQATRAVYTSYSTLGGYAFAYDSASVEDWSTVELGGGIMVGDEATFLSNAPERTFFVVLNTQGELTAQLSKTNG